MKSTEIETISKDQYSTVRGAARRLTTAHQYSESTRRIFDAEKYRKQIKEWVPLPSQVDTILDVGCGEGTYTQFLKEEFPNTKQIIGIDVSPAMIEIAKESFSGIDFKLEGMDNISLENETVDFVFSRLAIHYSEDLPKTMVEIARVTKPGGLFFLKDTHPFYATFLKKSLDYGKKENVRFKTQCDEDIEVIHPSFTFEEYINAISNAGWILLSMHEQYGRGVAGVTTDPYKLPTSVYFVLKKR